MKATIRELKNWLLWFKSGPCTDCGGTFDSSCMDLDHVPERGHKTGNIGEFTRGKLRGSMEDLWKEVAKCDLVCSNCHRLRTKSRGAVADPMKVSAGIRKAMTPEMLKKRGKAVSKGTRGRPKTVTPARLEQLRQQMAGMRTKRWS